MEKYTFRYCDIDFNRHVNTVRYLDLILNHKPLDFYDKNDVGRLDIIFHRECYFGETIELRARACGGENPGADSLQYEITRPEGDSGAVSARIIWRPKEAREGAKVS